jgi:hypothetical protein
LPRVQLNTQAVAPLSELASANLLQTLAEDLTAAIDLAKPAHIGLDISLLFGAAEDARSVIRAMRDTLKIIFNGIETAPLPPIFTLAPLEDPTSPETELTAYGKRVGTIFAPSITAVQNAALMSDAYRAEYELNTDGSYSLNPARVNDIILQDASGNPTGEISQAVGVLAPQLNKAWEIKSDTLKIYRLT